MFCLHWNNLCFIHIAIKIYILVYTVNLVYINSLLVYLHVVVKSLTSHKVSHILLQASKLISQKNIIKYLFYSLLFVETEYIISSLEIYWHSIHLILNCFFMVLWIFKEINQELIKWILDVNFCIGLMLSITTQCLLE